MSMHLGAYKMVFFDSARQVEYTPQLAKELASTVLESIAGQFDLSNVAQISK